jgi:hypothetical protein
VDPNLSYARVVARPLAALDRSRHVLLIFEPRTPLDEGDVSEPTPELLGSMP